MKRRMNTKKHYAVITVILAAMTLSVLAGCGKSAKNDPYVGLYEGAELEYDGYAMDVDAEDNYIELKDNGKLEIALMGETSSGKWKRDGDDITVELAHDDNEYEGVFEDGWLVLDFDEMVYSFYKEGGENSSVLSRLKAVEEGEIVYGDEEEYDYSEGEDDDEEYDEDDYGDYDEDDEYEENEDYEDE